jgi:tRNA (guanine-N7-)-methyltransferase
VGKNKLKRFEENLNFSNLVQPKLVYPPVDHRLKGNWRSEFFRNENPVVVELGCGRGEYTVNLARLFPGKNFIGIDWKGARLWRGAKTGHEAMMSNAGFLRIQIQTIGSYFAQGDVDELWITFPDPQMQKTRERKRLTSPRFLDIYRQFVKPGGIINLKTDSLPFYEYTLGVLDAQKIVPERATDDLYAMGTDEVLSIKTTYESIWLKEGARICYLRFPLNEKEG